MQFTWRTCITSWRMPKVPSASPWNGGATTRAEHLTRDYFRVESREGMRVWLYREGLFNDGAPPTWFLHGVFA